ncbi:MAG: hypothetical protein A3E01_10115 [Gammaproteobacteria bacterium RIFCSPHIGHO2_12_FULL_63_22]|nr:MAG: hypothetical protein A3E01_10115 [Gammaproteobacteria bacterium RIFCSPHIGHO2_12_FULL_63_22]
MLYGRSQRHPKAPIPGMVGHELQLTRRPLPFPEAGHADYLAFSAALGPAQGGHVRIDPAAYPPERVAALLAQAQAKARQFYVPHLHSQAHDEHPTCWTEAF